MYPFRLVGLLLSILFCVAATGHAATYYVSPSGSDSAAGSQAAPWKTVGHAADIIQAGDTVMIQAGMYYESGITFANSGTSQKPITLSGVDKNTVIIDGIGAASSASGIVLYAGTDYITIQNITIQNMPQNGIYTDEDAGNGYAGFTVKNCILKNNGWSGLELAAVTDFLIESVTADGNGFYGLNMLPLDNGSVSPNNGSILDSTFSNHTGTEGHGLGINQGSDITIRNCTAFHNRSHGFDISDLPKGLPVSEDITLEDNYAYDNGLAGFAVNSDSNGILLRRNIAWKNGASWAGSGTFSGFICYEGCWDVSWYNNVSVANSDAGFAVSDKPGTYVTAPSKAELRYKNNIAYGNSPSWSEDMGLMVEGSGWTVTAANNDFACSGDSSWNVVNLLGTYYSSAQVAGGAFQTSNISQDPKFKNLTTPDFHLQDDSPCIDAGTNVGGSYTGSAPDMGVYESSASNPGNNGDEGTAGSLDTSFGGGDGYTGYFVPGADDVLVDFDVIAVNGRIVAGCLSNDSFFTIHYDETGELDTGSFVFPTNPKESHFNAVVAHLNAYIYLAGWYGYWDTPQYPALWRLNISGSEDSIDEWDTYDEACVNPRQLFVDIDMQGDRPVAVGICQMYLIVQRFLSDTTFDTSFNNGETSIVLDFPVYGYEVRTTVQSDGKILATGTKDQDPSYPLFVARFTTDGKLDTGFGLGKEGFYHSNGGGLEVPCGMALQSDGKIIVCYTSQNKIRMIRLKTDGTLDTSFGPAGIYLGQEIEIPRDVEVAPDDKIVVVGRGADNKATIWRFTPDGALDTTFDSDGKVTFDAVECDSSDYAAVSVLSDGSILAGGTLQRESSDMFIAKYQGGELTSANSSPTANNDTASTQINTPITIQVLSNDTDPDGDTLGITTVSNPNHGTAVASGQSITYTPQTNYTGTDSFNYSISDGNGHTDTASVTVTVLSTPVTGDVRIYGNVDDDGAPVCAMVLANGEYMFTCDGQGAYDLTVPQDAQGKITLYCFCAKMAPYEYTFTPSSNSMRHDIHLSDPAGTEDELVVTHSEMQFVDGYTVAGTVTRTDGSPVCAMVLINGQYTFSSDADGTYSVNNIPTDAAGQLTIQAFCQGALPYSETYTPTPAP